MLSDHITTLLVSLVTLTQEVEKALQLGIPGILFGGMFQTNKRLQKDAVRKLQVVRTKLHMTSSSQPGEIWKPKRPRFECV